MHFQGKIIIICFSFFNFFQNLVITIMFYSGLRLLIILHYLYKFNLPFQILDWIYMLRYIAIFQESFTVFCIVAERSLAAKFSKKYEKVKFNIIPICAIICAWSLSTLLVIYSLHYGKFYFIIFA